jgi:hypothetical protein
LKKDQNQRTTNPAYFKNLKEVVIFMKELLKKVHFFVADYLIILIF